MNSKIAALIVVVCASGFCVASSEAAEDQKLWDWLVDQTNEAPFEEMPTHRAVYSLLRIAENCEAMQRRELADHFLQRAETIVEKSEKPNYYNHLFHYAEKLNRLELAEKYVNKAGRSDYLLDSLDLARFRSGDKDAIKKFPREESTFYNALGLVDAYIQVGDFKAVEEFVSDLKISEENDPRDVAGIAFKRIAKLYREKGDMKNARHYADKALAVAGNNYYTGFSIRVFHHTLHGTLLKNVKEFADRAVRYRGHHTRELLQHLIGELVFKKHFEEAQEVAKRFEKQEETDESLQSIAAAQAREGLLDAAHQTAGAIKGAAIRNVARLEIAKAIWKSGNRGSAEKLVDDVYRVSKDEADQDEDQQRKLANLFAIMGRQTELQEIFRQATTPDIHGFCILAAVAGYAESLEKK